MWKTTRPVACGFSQNTDRKPQGTFIKISCGRIVLNKHVHGQFEHIIAWRRNVHNFIDFTVSHRIKQTASCACNSRYSEWNWFSVTKNTTLCRQIGLLLRKANSKVTIIVEITIYFGKRFAIQTAWLLFCRFHYSNNDENRSRYSHAPINHSTLFKIWVN